MTGIILAHGQAADTVKRHTENWRAAFTQLIFISPSDDYLPGSIPMGTSARAGIGSLERLLFAAVMASRFDAAAVLEYDTLIFGCITANLIPENTLLCSEVFVNDDPLFTAPSYGHSPWIARGETWWRLVTAGADTQRGVPDRWLALAAHNAGVDVCGMGGYSCDKEWSSRHQLAAQAARRNGAIAIHGAKTFNDFVTITA